MVPGAVVVADLALSVLDPPEQQRRRLEHVRAAARRLGLPLPATGPAIHRVVVHESTATTSLRVFGGFGLEVDGRRIDVSALKPQARTVMAVLAMRTPAPVHREHLGVVLWPDEEQQVQMRRLPVLISTVRRFLEPDALPGDWQVLRRVGEAYVLDLPPPSWVDIRVFDEAVAAARAMGGTGGIRRREYLRIGFTAYGGTLLPEFGAEEWLVHEREHYRLQAGDIAEELGRAELDAGRPERCIDYVRVGLREDRYRSGLWRLLVRANEQLGDVAAAARSRQQHREALEELGVGEVRVGPLHVS